MSKKKEYGAPSGNVMAVDSEVRAPSAIKITVKAVLEVTPEYLKNVNGNAAILRGKLEEAVEGLNGAVVSMEIA